MSRWLVPAWIALAVGCGDNLPDPDPILTLTDPGGAVVGRMAFPRSAVAHEVTATLHLGNRGNTATGALEVSIIRATSSSFAILGASTCPEASLSPGDECVIVLQFRPTAVGEHAAKLEIRGERDGSLELDLDGLGAYAQLVLDPPAIDFGFVDVGTSATFTARVVNDSDVIADIEQITARDDDFSNAFSLASTACGPSLDPGASCEVTVRFSPFGIRPFSGFIQVSDGNLVHAFEIDGVGAGSDLYFFPVAVDLEPVRVGTVGTTQVTLYNEGNVAAPLDAITVTGTGFTKGPTTCGALLAAGNFCDITVELSPAAVIPYAGTLAVTSDGVVRTAALSGHGAEPMLGFDPIDHDFGVVEVGDVVTQLIRVTNSGNASTTIDSIAVTGAGFRLVSESCPGTLLDFAFCNVVVEFAPTATATFSGALVVTAEGFDHVAPLAGEGVSHDLVLAFAGNATGELRVTGPTGELGRCSSTCVVPLPPGATVEVWAATPSTFAGFTGACTTTDPSCSFMASSSGQTLTATFTKDAKELWTFLGLPSETFVAAAYDGSNHLLVGSSSRLVKLDANAGIVWSRPIPTSAVVVGPGDTIYVYSGAELIKLDAAGMPVWTRALANGCVGLMEDHPRCLAIAPNGDVVVRSAGVSVWDAAGTFRWSQPPELEWIYASVAVDSAGLVYVARRDADNELAAARFTADGAPLAPLFDIGDGYHGTFVVDASDRLVTAASGNSNAFLASRLAGANVFGIARMTASAGDVPNAVAVTGADELGWMYQRRDGGTGYVFERITPAGTSTWSLDRTPPGQSSIGVWPATVAGAPDGRLAITGAYSKDHTTPRVGFVQVYAP